MLAAIAAGSSRAAAARPEPAAASFLDPNHGWALVQAGCASCAELLTTRDGGRTWTALPRLAMPLGFASRSSGSVTDVFFADAENGYLFGPGLWLTHDGGASWKRGALSGVDGLSSSVGSVFAFTGTRLNRPRLWRNLAGADRWIPVALPHGGQFPAVDDSRGFAFDARGSSVLFLRRGVPLSGGGSGFDAGGLWVSRDGGATWAARTVPCRSPFGGAAAIALAPGNPERLYLDCFDDRQSQQMQDTRHRVYVSSDGGRSWTLLGLAAHTGDPVLLGANAAGNLFLATESGAGDHLAASFDGGRRWSTVLSSGGNFFGWADLRFVSAKVGFVVGPTHDAPEHVYRTEDGGRTWQALRLSG